MPPTCWSGNSCFLTCFLYFAKPPAVRRSTTIQQPRGVHLQANCCTESEQDFIVFPSCSIATVDIQYLPFIDDLLIDLRSGGEGTTQAPPPFSLFSSICPIFQRTCCVPSLWLIISLTKKQHLCILSRKAYVTVSSCRTKKGLFNLK